MTDTAYFGPYVVEHEDWNLSYVYRMGAHVKTFKGKEDSWAAAERWAQDQHFKELYG